MLFLLESKLSTVRSMYELKKYVINQPIDFFFFENGGLEIGLCQSICARQRI